MTYVILYELVPDELTIYEYDGLDEWFIGMLTQAHGKLVNVHDIDGELTNFIAYLPEDNRIKKIWDSEHPENEIPIFVNHTKLIWTGLA